MNNKKLTKIVCDRIEDKFIVLFLRWRKISKTDLKLKPSKGTTMKITDPSIKASIKTFFEEYQQSGLSLVEYFRINLVVAIESSRSNNRFEFNLRETTFDQSIKVRYSLYYK